MKDQAKTKAQLLKELNALRKEVADWREAESERKQAERALRESEELFREIAEAVRDIFFVVDHKNYSVLYVNPAYETIWGRTCESLFQEPSSWIDAIFSEDREQVNAAFEEQQRTGKFNEEFRITRPDGSIRWIHDRVFPIRYPKGEVYRLVGIAEDITERKRAEEELRESTERFSLAVRATQDGIWDWNIITNEEYFAPRWCEILGYSDDDPELPHTFAAWSSRIHPDDHERVMNALKAHLEKGEVYNVEYRHRYITGEYRWQNSRGQAVFDKNGKPVRMVGCIRDITEHKHAETLREKEKFIRAVTNALPLCISYIDAQQRYRFVNRVYEDWFSQKSSEILGKHVREVLGEKGYANVKNHIEKTLAGETSRFETRVPKVDGGTRELGATLIPDFDDSGAVRGYYESVQDFTEHKRLEKELARSQRLESAARVASQIAHDFNNLLGPLVAYPTLIREELPANHSILEMVDEIELCARRMADINQQLLTLGRRGHYRTDPIDLNDLIHNVTLAQNLPKELAVREELCSSLLLIEGGDAQLSRAIINLIVNAEEAMKHSGVLGLKTENVYLDKPIKGYKTIKRGEYVKLEISDTGDGIKPDILDKIFDPFFTTKKMSRQRGSGLGLSVVHGVVEDHNGYVTVESPPGKGTTFSLYLPVSRKKEIAETIEKAKGGDEKILVIDDDPAQRKVASQLLGRLGYKVHAVSSGERAIANLKRHRQDLLVVDMVMDGIDGAETYKRILEFQPNQRAILLSGFAVTKRVEEALRLGAGSFVPKPVNLNSLAIAVRMELDRNLN